MTRQMIGLLSATAFVGLTVCGSSSATHASGLAQGTTTTPSPTFDQVKGWVEAYKAAHSGNGGKDWDINAKSPAQIAALVYCVYVPVEKSSSNWRFDAAKRLKLSEASSCN